MQDLKIFGDAVDKYLRVRTLPVAIKLLKGEEDIPKSAHRPLKDLGHRVITCQGVAFARVNNVTLAMLKEDMYCPLGLTVLGLVEPHSFWLEGNTNYKRLVGTRKAAIRMVRETPRFEVGEYIGVVTSPLPYTDFDVDLVLTYCNPAQAMRFIAAALYNEGGYFEASLFSVAVCSGYLVKTMRTGKCQLCIPGLGDHRYGITHDDELAFATPVSRLREIATGLEKTHQAGLGIPVRAGLSWEMGMANPYVELSKLVDMVEIPGLGKGDLRMAQ